MLLHFLAQLHSTCGPLVTEAKEGSSQVLARTAAQLAMQVRRQLFGRLIDARLDDLLGCLSSVTHSMLCARKHTRTCLTTNLCHEPLPRTSALLSTLCPSRSCSQSLLTQPPRCLVLPPPSQAPLAAAATTPSRPTLCWSCWLLHGALSVLLSSSSWSGLWHSRMRPSRGWPIRRSLQGWSSRCGVVFSGWG